MRSALRAARLMAAAVGTGSGAGPGPKRPRSEPAPRIGTHDGTFHCDEVLACYLLRLLPRYRVRPAGHRAAGAGLRPARVPWRPGRLPPGTPSTGQEHRAVPRPLPALESFRGATF